MLYLNKKEINVERFPDGTPRIKLDRSLIKPTNTIGWFFENIEELFILQCLCGELKCGENVLYLPYIPNARQDRAETETSVCTLKYFAEVINSLNFKEVYALTPHSRASFDYIDNLKEIEFTKILDSAIEIIKQYNEIHILFLPDKGAKTQFEPKLHKYDLPILYGEKHRDFSTGKITKYSIDGDVEGKNILIIDDICSYGGTFLKASKLLKELGAKDISMFVSHCENSILKGSLMECWNIKTIVTTNSLLKEEELIPDKQYKLNILNIKGDAYEI